MNIKDLLKKLFPDKTADIEQLDEAVAEKVVEKQTENKDIEALKNLVATSQAENKKLLDELTSVKQKEADREKLLNDKAVNEAKLKVENAIKKAIDEKKIPAKDDAMIEKYKKLFTSDFETAEAIINNLPAMVEKKSGDKETKRSNDKENPDQFSKPDRKSLISEIKSQMESYK